MNAIFIKLNYFFRFAHNLPDYIIQLIRAEKNVVECLPEVNFICVIAGEQLNETHETCERRPYFMRLHPGDLHKFLVLQFQRLGLLLLLRDVQRKTNQLISALAGITLDKNL